MTTLEVCYDDSGHALQHEEGGASEKDGREGAEGAEGKAGLRR